MITINSTKNYEKKSLKNIEYIINRKQNLTKQLTNQLKSMYKHEIINNKYKH